VLFIVFEHYVFAYNGLPEVLLLVCRLWYEVATRVPGLWAELDPKKQIPKIKHHKYPIWTGSFIWTRCVRSNPAPLDLDFAFLDYYANQKALFLQVMQIPSIIDRCRSLVINRNHELALLTHPSGLPCLEELTLGVYNAGDDIRPSEPLQWRVELCPHFRALHLFNIYTENWPSRLFELPSKLTVSFGFHVSETSSIFAPLAKAFNVQDLTLNVDLEFIYDEEEAGVILECPPLTFQHVTRLSINYENELPDRPRHPFRNLAFPALTSFEVSTETVDYLGGILKGPIYTLRRFHFSHHPDYYCPSYLNDQTHTTKTVLDVLKMMPNIDHLELSLNFDVMEGIALGLENDSLLCRNLRTLKYWDHNERSGENSVNQVFEARVEERFRALQG
jgi:hypothetical protein